MKIITLLLLSISTLGFAQTTYIPDDNFEQELINLGFDSGPLDDYVPTANINTEWTLSIGFKGITDLTGIEDFTELRTLYLAGNDLTTLDMSNNLQLSNFNCLNNDLTSLDISANMQLTNFNCSGNNLTSLNIKNGTNGSINSFNASNNPNLTCITVDDVDYSTNNWTNIDAQTSFNESCSALSNDNFDLTNMVVLYPNPASDIVTIKSNSELLKTEFYNMLGKNILTTSSNKISLKSFTTGIYILRVFSDTYTFSTKKLIVQ